MSQESAAIGAALRDKAIADVERANKEFVACGLIAVRVVALRREEFTTDAVWHVLKATPPEPRAMGAVMRKAVMEKMCVATDRTVLSTRPDCHRRPVRVWRSLIYTPQP